MHQEINAMFDLSGKVALVTGGARTLGFDMACILSAAGAKPAITSRTLANAQKSALQLEERYGVEALALQLDVTNSQAVQTAAKRVQKWQGRIDVLINNAGGATDSGPMRLFKRSAEDITRLVNTNLNGALYCCREVGKVMADQGAGKIINIASIAGLLGRDRRMYDRSSVEGQPIDYAAAKAGVIGMTMDLAAYLSPMGVYVNCISPGGFDRNLSPSFVKDYSDRTPLGRMGRDGIDLKGAALFLASAASDYVTGHNLVVDGGFSIWQ